MMRAISIIGVLAACVAVLLHCKAHVLLVADAEGDRFDVNDVSFLWPAPSNKNDVDALMSVDDKLADGVSPVLPQQAFDNLLATAQQVVVTDSAGREIKIVFGTDNRGKELKDQFLKRSTWKIVAFRVDPSAPGTAPMLTAAFGSAPQLRLIIQPVTVDDAGSVTVHDVTAHIVYTYVKAPANGKAVPDKGKFGEIVKDLKALKTSAQNAGASTNGKKLGVHPGFKKGEDFSKQVKSFLKKHLGGEKLSAMAFMGINPPEPWIFFAMRKDQDQFVLMQNPSLGGKSSQMLTFRGGTPVMPSPQTTNVDKTRGVNTASLISLTDPADNKLGSVVFPNLPNLKHKYIPDLVANPQRAHFFNTDCISCHSESSRRNLLKIDKTPNDFQFAIPAGISGVDESFLPKSKWNVRNFGWFPPSAGALLLPR